MKIFRDDDHSLYVFFPANEEEKRILARISKDLRPEDRISYIKSEQDGDSDIFVTVYLKAGTINFNLWGSDIDDKYEVNGIHNTCYFGSDGLIFIGEIEEDGEKGIVVTAKYCNNCRSRMIRTIECVSSICNLCSSQCPHEYICAFFLGRDKKLNILEFCRICGRGLGLDEEDLSTICYIRYIQSLKIDITRIIEIKTFKGNCQSREHRN